MIVSARHCLVLIQISTALSMAGLYNLRRLSLETREAQVASDLAFDKGDLRQSLKEAQYASLVSTSDQQYAKRSTERLEAIAVGSEATGRPKTALLAWSSLSATNIATRSFIPTNSRLGQQSEQHMNFLLSKVTNRPMADVAQTEPLIGSSLRLANHWWGGAPFLVGAGLLLGVLGFLLKRESHGAGISSRIFDRSLYLAATSCWIVGWIVA